MNVNNKTSVMYAIAVALMLCASSTANAQGKQNHLYKSGYDDVPRFGGPSSVGGTLEEDDRAEGYRFDGLQRGLKPYFDWKARVNEKAWAGLFLRLHRTLPGRQ